MAAHPTRRAVLAATAALPLLVTGCKGTQALGTPPRPAPDVGVLNGAITTEELMIARYTAAIRVVRDGQAAGAGAERGISATLAALLAEHRAHLSQLRSRLVRGSPLAAGSAPPPAPTTPSLPPAAQVIGYLASAEQAASDRLLSQVGQVPPALAQLFASISASEATHVPALHAAGAS